MTTGSDVVAAAVGGIILGWVTRGLNDPGREEAVVEGADVLERAGVGLNDNLARPTVSGEVCSSVGAFLSSDWSNDELFKEDTNDAENMVEPSDSRIESCGMEGSKNGACSSANKDWSGRVDCASP